MGRAAPCRGTGRGRAPARCRGGPRRRRRNGGPGAALRPKTVSAPRPLGAEVRIALPCRTVSTPQPRNCLACGLGERSTVCNWTTSLARSPHAYAALLAAASRHAARAPLRPARRSRTTSSSARSTSSCSSRRMNARLAGAALGVLHARGGVSLGDHLRGVPPRNRRVARVGAPSDAPPPTVRPEPEPVAPRRMPPQCRPPRLQGEYAQRGRPTVLPPIMPTMGRRRRDIRRRCLAEVLLTDPAATAHGCPRRRTASRKVWLGRERGRGPVGSLPEDDSRRTPVAPAIPRADPVRDRDASPGGRLRTAVAR